MQTPVAREQSSLRPIILSAVGIGIATCLSWASMETHLAAVELVSANTIQIQKRETEIFKLKNGIPVLLRRLPGSDIAVVHVTFAFGQAHTPRKQTLSWAISGMSLGAKGFPKDQVFALSEKYGLDMNCGTAVELSSCAMQVVDEYWDKGLPLLAASIREPIFHGKDMAIAKERTIAEVKHLREDPNKYVNDIVNRMFYPENHPYRSIVEDNLLELGKATLEDVRALHRDMLNAARMQIVVVSALPRAKIEADLNKEFAKIRSAAFQTGTVETPPFEKVKSSAFENREIPSAYVLAKFPMPSMTSPDYAAARLLVAILSEHLDIEIRTNSALSYSVGAHALFYRMGIGMLYASTSRPKETLEKMAQVIMDFRKVPLTDKEVELNKRIFATEYYMAQESHLTLAGALANSMLYFGSADPFYEFPTALAKVDAAAIHRIATAVLGNFRIGVLYDKEKFDAKWTQNFVEQTLIAGASKP